ncbi:hypothetical protein BL250_13155 [Erwinia sp. OLTSP20]|uniref:nitrilase-related carbon-nitrogen hydrolase n=1 Tax=unclassified Erwinia TaxID=2622719 RepID=UPI000C190191|nr:MULTISPECIES: nitrilase-related carbon-nitrogen hydrolase [unclassified Erwinia]PIJ49409.1 hypothetical protein BV501_12890 [Erwinia sp. OAMSP11]PIJ71085.1 hypothetical protein BK416_12075 [Erwinia sp. OLSSP12]PIJ79363.1 hypothetical protein BLD47_14405 [Erwinia sp. OLCASP19]PIJ80901.1 hypothetical protein BLD46_13655 [Erwinia sp. OLMTSP26]PIJ83703.1 hypothetical protein BLD49_12935 [Erwinia sp. OLMDSP33]
MRIAIIQSNDAPDSQQAMVAWLTAGLDQAADAQLVIWPELALCGYDDAQRIRRLAITADSEQMSQIAALARRRQQTLVFGYAEQHGVQLFNAVRAIGPQGETLANYRKTHLWNGYEKALFTAGNRLQTFTLAGMRFGLLICYDLDFPELSRLYAQQGIDCLLCISATSPGYELIAHHLVPARAYENGYFVVFANRGDTQGAAPCIGMSRLAGPDGNTLAALAGAGAGIIAARLDVSIIQRWRQHHPLLADRHPQLYQLTGY